jgi:hypothetical protein
LAITGIAERISSERSTGDEAQLTVRGPQPVQLRMSPPKKLRELQRDNANDDAID